MCSAASADNSANAKLCQHGGWQSFRQIDGTTLKNEGACVSYAAHGGTLATFTTSTTNHVTYVHVDLAAIHAYSTRIQAFADLHTVCDGIPVVGMFLDFDQTLLVPADSAEVGAAFEDARDAVTSHVSVLECGGALVFAGPSLVSSTETSQTVFVDSVFDHAVVTTTTTTTAGPATVFVGTDQSQALFVPAGTVNVNANTDTDTLIDQRYQATVLLSTLYVVTGSLN